MRHQADRAQQADADGRLGQTRAHLAEAEAERLSAQAAGEELSEQLVAANAQLAAATQQLQGYAQRLEEEQGEREQLRQRAGEQDSEIRDMEARLQDLTLQLHR